MNRTTYRTLWTVALLLLGMAASEIQAQRIWRDRDDFEEGVLVSVGIQLNDDDEFSRLELTERGRPLEFLWVPCTGRGAVARIDVREKKLIGLYRSAPRSQGRMPVGTAVDGAGNVWVANSEAHGGAFCPPDGVFRPGSVTRVGVIIGGTRVRKLDPDCVPPPGGECATVEDPNGEWLKPPFKYNTCIDRDGDGLIRTSRGFNDILPWNNRNGTDTCGGVATATDEAILNFTRVNGWYARTVAVDPAGDVWVGGTSNCPSPSAFHEKVSGFTGVALAGTQINENCGGSGGLVDSDGILWSIGDRECVGGDADLQTLQYDTVFDTIECGLNARSRGIALDRATGNVFTTCFECADPPRSQLRQFHRDRSRVAVYDIPAFDSEGNGPLGVAVDQRGHVWVAEADGTRVAHFAPSCPDPRECDYELVGIIDGFFGTTGLSVDTDGYVWVTERDADSVSSIDPNAGDIVIVGGRPIPMGAVDATIYLGERAGPESITDGTGTVFLDNTLGGEEGFWSDVHDSGAVDTAWGILEWRDIRPLGTQIEVLVRASNDGVALFSEEFVRVENGVPFSGVNGRYAEVRVRFLRPGGSGVAPAVFNVLLEPLECFLLIAGGEGGEPFSNGGGHVFPTHLGPLDEWHPVLIEDNPPLRIPIPAGTFRTTPSGAEGQAGARVPVRRMFAQVLMWNPNVFPENPEQFTQGIEVNVWPDGTVTTRRFGDKDGMDIDVEVLERHADHLLVKFPFSIQGMEEE